MCAIAMAEAGRFEEAERALQIVERCARDPEENIEVGWIRMTLRALAPAGSIHFGYFGAGEGIRTLDVNLGKVALYH
jgi:hypothetical protein